MRPLGRVLDNGFRHVNVVAGDLGLDFCRKGRGAGFNVAEMTVKGRKGRAWINYPEVDGDATVFAKVVFGGVHQFPAQAGPLEPGIYAEETQIAAIAAKFDVNATSEARGIFRDQEFSFFHVGADALGIRAVALNEGLLNEEGGVDQAGEGFDIGFLREANVHVLGVLAGIGYAWHRFISAELRFLLQEGPLCS